MTRFEDTVEVDVPVRVAYDQWTRFREFPEFMDGVDSVEQLDAGTLSWVGTVDGRRRIWRTRIVERTPDVRVAWQDIGGPGGGGTVLFRSLGLDRTLVTLRLDIALDASTVLTGAQVRSVEQQVRGDLRRFKAFVEAHLVAAGPWLGRLHGRRGVGVAPSRVLAGR